MKLVLASKNKKKLVEMQQILSDLGVEVVLQADLGIDVDVEETGTTFAENAMLKAKATSLDGYVTINASPEEAVQKIQELQNNIGTKR